MAYCLLASISLVQQGKREYNKTRNIHYAISPGFGFVHRIPNRRGILVQFCVHSPLAVFTTPCSNRHWARAAVGCCLCYWHPFLSARATRVLCRKHSCARAFGVRCRPWQRQRRRALRGGLHVFAKARWSWRWLWRAGGGAQPRRPPRTTSATAEPEQHGSGQAKQ